MATRRTGRRRRSSCRRSRRRRPRSPFRAPAPSLPPSLSPPARTPLFPSLARQGRSCRAFAILGDTDKLGESFLSADLLKDGCTASESVEFEVTTRRHLSKKAMVGPSTTARLFNPFSNSGISVSAPAPAPARARPVAVPCLPACLHEQTYGGGEAALSCLYGRGRTDAYAWPGPVRNRRCPKIQRRRPRRRRRHRRPRGSGRPAATTTTVRISGGRFIPCEMISRPFHAWNNILMGHSHDTRSMAHNCNIKDSNTTALCNTVKVPAAKARRVASLKDS